MLSAVHFFNAKYGLKVKAYHIKSEKNSSADTLSRGKIPSRLKLRGMRKHVDFDSIVRLIDNPLHFWNKTSNPF